VVLTRRGLVASAAGAALAALGLRRSGIGLAAAPVRAVGPAEQHVLPKPKVVVYEGVEVVVPPLHNRVLTARLLVDPNRAALHDARGELESALAQLDAQDGLAVTVAWGLPYFRRYVSAQTRRELPVDRRASSDSHTVGVLEDAHRFPSDPEDTLLESNDLAIFLRSDDPGLIDQAQQLISDRLAGVLALTSVRTGVVGGGFDGSESLPNQVATAAKIKGADLMPPTAELFLGFTSTVKAGLGPPKIANFETLGYAALPSPYFVGGTHMHLSHIDEDMRKWYLDFDHRERVDAMFHPGVEIPAHRQTVPQGHAHVESIHGLHRDYSRYGKIGHAGSIQAASRLDRDIVARDGTVYRKGTAVPQRADFNTIDNPFAWSASPARDRMSSTPRAGVHFVVFNPSSDDFRRVRLAMDGILPDGTRLAFKSTFPEGLNAVLRTTHRQNFLVPPRARRSFPLSELRA
jgi:hypothetical protein